MTKISPIIFISGLDSYPQRGQSPSMQESKTVQAGERTHGMRPKEYMAFLNKLARCGFELHLASSRIFQRTAEVYYCGCWTVEVGAAESDCDQATVLYIETYFDREELDYRAKRSVFPIEQFDKAIAYARAQVAGLRGDLLCDAFATVD